MAQRFYSGFFQTCDDFTTLRTFLLYDVFFSYRIREGFFVTLVTKKLKSFCFF